ncbi:hypothetical protein CWATWH0402_4371 [Crocosphaera watsonii WH 0402]|uniref:Uncharacterized protein n=2 Tax=Crocosphaera watsonii TaxID=263511 RepID=T2JZR9_CROWT|nr:hypothetical protein CWATWH0005_2641 [Crocosphaera watsonii WH 0005]CCQ70785.1 hypothetical protein CWATWH0402_4371 [Crocosphaera watsonii WH 0402]
MVHNLGLLPLFLCLFFYHSMIIIDDFFLIPENMKGKSFVIFLFS